MSLNSKIRSCGYENCSIFHNKNNPCNNLLLSTRSQSFSSVEKKSNRLQKNNETYFLNQPDASISDTRRFTLNSFDYGKGDLKFCKSETVNSKLKLEEDFPTASVIQKSKTFSKFLSQKGEVDKSFSPNSKDVFGMVSAQDEFFMQMSTSNTKNLSLNEDNSSSTFLAKAKLTHLLKTTQSEQFSKLQSKHQQECDLLDDIRNFSKQKCQIEKEYAQALQKLLLQYQKRDWLENVDEEENDHVSIYRVWKGVLDFTRKTAQARMNAGEVYRSEIYEAAKSYRNEKDSLLKKSQELLTSLHSEVMDTVKEMAKTKKRCFETEQACNAVREKYEEINEKLKRNHTSIFKSKSGLEKTVQKLKQKSEEHEKINTMARNEYLLELCAANAHQKRFYETDLPETMKVLDGNVFEKLCEYMDSMIQCENKLCLEMQDHCANFTKLSCKISHEYETRRFLEENSIFEWAAMYEFESLTSSNKDKKLIEEQPGEDNSLNREARKWTFRVERDKRNLEQLQNRKNDLERLLLNSKENPGVMAAEFSMQDIMAQLQKCKDDIRKSETSCLLGHSRLSLLEEANVDLKTWFESARVQLSKSGSVSTPGGLTFRKGLQLVTTQDESISPNIFALDDDAFFDEDSDDEFEDKFDEDTSSIQTNSSIRIYPLTCLVNFPYEATRSDELTIAVGDKVEVIEDGDLDQWVKARDKLGNLGYVPENYIQFPSPRSKEKRSLSSSVEVVKSKSSSASVSSSINDQEVMSINERTQTSNVRLAKSIYSYEACSNEELSFPVGAVINILPKDSNDVDDGWWKGEFNGKIGDFPALVVEEITAAKDPTSQIDRLPNQPKEEVLLPLSGNTRSQFSPIDVPQSAKNVMNAKQILSEFNFQPTQHKTFSRSLSTSLDSKPTVKRRAPAPPKRTNRNRHSCIE